MFCTRISKLYLVKSQFRNVSTFTKFREWYRGLWRPELDTPQPAAPYKHVCQIGDPVLRGKAEDVDVKSIQSEEIRKVISYMKSAMKRYDIVGIAAPQIGIPLRIIAVEFSEKTMDLYSPEMRASREMEICKRTVIVNPTIKIMNPQQIKFTEGCVSVNGFSALISRHREIVVSGFNENAEEFSWQVKGWLARIVQHECDHLDGTMLTDKMDPKTFQFDYWYTVNTSSGQYVHRYIR